MAGQLILDSLFFCSANLQIRNLGNPLYVIDGVDSIPTAGRS